VTTESGIGIAQQVTSALAVAEKHGLVHRDLKPANLMLVSPDGATGNNKKLVVKIIDFGLAKAIHTATDPKSLTHDRFVGTPAFASPEQFEHSALDVRSDIYSLGETLWLRSLGKRPLEAAALKRFTAPKNQMCSPSNNSNHRTSLLALGCYLNRCPHSKRHLGPAQTNWQRV